MLDDRIQTPPGGSFALKKAQSQYRARHRAGAVDVFFLLSFG